MSLLPIMLERYVVRIKVEKSVYLVARVRGGEQRVSVARGLRERSVDEGPQRGRTQRPQQQVHAPQVTPPLRTRTTRTFIIHGIKCCLSHNCAQWALR
jgi:hypothetical protein